MHTNHYADQPICDCTPTIFDQQLFKATTMQADQTKSWADQVVRAGKSKKPTKHQGTKKHQGTEMEKT